MEIDRIKLEDDEQYARAKENLARMQERLVSTQKEIEALAAEVGDCAATSPLEENAAKVLAGQEPTNLSASTDNAHRIQQKTLYKRVIEEAIRQAKKRLLEAQYVAGNKIAERVFPEYKAIVIRLAAALKAAAQIADEEAQFRERLFLADIAFTNVFRAMPFNRLGSLRDEFSPVNMFLREVAEYHGNGNGKPPKAEVKVKKSAKAPGAKIQMISNYASPSGFTASVGEVVDFGSDGEKLVAAGAATQYLGPESNLVAIREKVWSIKKKPARQ